MENFLTWGSLAVAEGQSSVPGAGQAFGSIPLQGQYLQGIVCAQVLDGRHREVPLMS